MYQYYKYYNFISTNALSFSSQTNTFFLIIFSIQVLFCPRVYYVNKSNSPHVQTYLLNFNFASDQSHCFKYYSSRFKTKERWNTHTCTHTFTSAISTTVDEKGEVRCVDAASTDYRCFLNKPLCWFVQNMLILYVYTPSVCLPPPCHVWPSDLSFSCLRVNLQLGLGKLVQRVPTATTKS